MTGPWASQIGPRVLRFGSGVAVAGPPDTVENTLASIVIPAYSMGPNGFVKVHWVTSHTNSANNKFWRVKLGSIGFTALTRTTQGATMQWLTKVQNQNNVASQKSFNNQTNIVFGDSGAAVTTGAVNTAVDQTLTITVQKALGTESMVLECWDVEVVYLP